jgi:hypothetical protein
MQRTEKIDISKIGNIVRSIFKEPAIAYEDYSKFDTELKKYVCEEALLDAINEAVKSESHSANFALYYPEAKGYFFEEKKAVNPVKCNGATYRYVASGWGLVHLQIDLRKKPFSEVRVAVNTAKRAETWFPTCPEFNEPSLWDWKYIEKQARRIIGTLKQSA